jgi:hypothetical protein
MWLLQGDMKPTFHKKTTGTDRGNVLRLQLKSSPSASDKRSYQVEQLEIN